MVSSGSVLGFGKAESHLFGAVYGLLQMVAESL